MYELMYVYTYACICLYVFMHELMYVYTYACICLYVCMFVGRYVKIMYVCKYSYVCMLINEKSQICHDVEMFRQWRNLDLKIKL